jgi:diguanylate cyclase
LLLPYRIIDTMRHQTRIVLHITMRDLAKRLAAITMVLSICYYAGGGVAVFYLAAFILLCEIVIKACHAAMPDRDGEIPVTILLVVLITNCVSTVGYVVPGVLLAQHGSVPLLLTGFMWVFGVFVHISNSFVALPLYNWSQMVPAFLTMFVMLRTAAFEGYAANNQWEWLILMALTVVYASNTFETLTQQKDTRRALDIARNEATARLRALEAMTQRDGLTGLLNRQTFDLELAQLLTRRRPGQHVAVLVIDLDGFKPINDTYSHAAGDTVLTTIAHRLAAVVPAPGIAARIGGDEFALAVPGLSSPQAALCVADAVLEAICNPIIHNEKLLRIGASIGIGLSGQADDSVARISGDADQAMYRAKGGTAGKAVLFDPATFPDRMSHDDRMLLIDGLRNGQIRPHYQPTVHLATGALAGFEALARWYHPTRGVLTPSAFLDQLGNLGLQGDFLTCITGQVLRDVSSLLQEGIDPGQVSLNLPEIALATQSGRRDLDALIADHPAALSHITFEITEDVFIARAGETIREGIAHYRRAGISVSLDDFGTGFASFQHLRQLEFDELKIDPSFVADLGRDPVAGVLVAGFLSIANGLGVRVIAEGIEAEEQRSLLLRMGCRFGQGYLFGRALPFEEARIRLLAEATRLPRAEAVAQA